MKDFLTDELLDGPAFLPCEASHEAIFLEAIKQEIAHQAAGCPAYAKFLERKGYNVEQGASRLEDIPYIPVQVFKVMGTELLSVPREAIYTTLFSSSTSGQASTVMVDRLTAKRQRKAMMKVVSDFIGTVRRPFWVFDVDPHASVSTGLNARSAAIRAYLNFSSRADFFVQDSSDGLTVLRGKLESALTELSPDEPIVVCAFTYVLYGSVVRPAKTEGIHYTLPAGSKIIHIGGWKKLEAEKVSKPVFMADIAEIFGVKLENIIDIYGFTEQMGVNYPDCACGCKHTPAIARVLVRDPETHVVLGDGQTGVLEFISPLPHSYPGNAVLTDDIGHIESGRCPHGRGGVRFKVLGRQKKAEVRGCGDIMGAKIRGATVPVDGLPSQRDMRMHKVSNGTELESMDAVLRHVRSKVNWLREQPVESLIGLISQVAETWMENPALSPWKYQGLPFLVRWCQGTHLRLLLSEGLNGLPGAMDGFCHKPGSGQQLVKAYPKGLVCHWLSGNVPLLGMLVLVQSIITKNINILKVASRQTEALEALFATFAGVRHVSPGGHAISGDDLLETVALVYHDRTDKDEAGQLSAAADVRVAWGGREAVEAICSLPSRVGCEDIVFGPKTSFMVISKDALDSERVARKLVRRAATDVSAFDQMACASPHTIFVEAGGFLSPREFAARLAEQMELALQLIPKEPEDQAALNAIQTARAVGEFMGDVWHGSGPGWTVLLDEARTLAKPTYSRVITVRSVDDILEAAELVHPDVQTIGLAAKGTRRLAFADAAASRGALRFPKIGRMTHFDSPWDGIIALSGMIRWAVLGGPLL